MGCGIRRVGSQVTIRVRGHQGTAGNRAVQAPDETRWFVDRGKADNARLGHAGVGRFVLESGRKWYEHVKPILGTEGCQVRHVGYFLSGQMKVVMDDGAGEAAVIPPWHDAWIVGDETCVWPEFAGDHLYAVGGSHG